MRARILPALSFALCLAGAAAPALARDLTGSLGYLARIALPDDAEILLELRDRDGIVAEVRLPTEGQQVPLPFRLEDVPAGPLLVRGAIAVGGEVRWLGDPEPVAADTADLDLGLLLVWPHFASGFVTTFACGSEVVRAGFAGGDAVLDYDGEQRRLPPVPAASGARFSDGATDATEFRSEGDGEGDTATVIWSGVAMPPCRAFALPEERPFAAFGNEPFWRLDLSADGLRLTTPEGEEPGAAALPPPVFWAERVVYLVPGGPTVTLWPERCHDSMAGMPYPVTVAIEDGTEQGRRIGCGGDPADLLAGAWTVTAIDGEPLPEGAPVTMEFAGDRVAGRSGCNRYTGGYSLTGEGLSFGPAAGTRMACPEPQMRTETAFFAALQAVDRFDFDMDGALVLMGADTPRITARR